MRTAPLNDDEMALWRALTRVIIGLPKALDEELAHATGVSLSEYLVLMNLSEAPGRALRMTELANATSLSGSRMTRIVDSLARHGLVTKTRSISDGRGFVATLTDEGFARLGRAYPSHLASARDHVVDRIPGRLVKQLGQALADIAEGLSPHD